MELLPLWANLSLVLAAALLLTLGAKVVVDSAVAMAKRLGISELVLGLATVGTASHILIGSATVVAWTRKSHRQRHLQPFGCPGTRRNSRGDDAGTNCEGFIVGSGGNGPPHRGVPAFRMALEPGGRVGPCLRGGHAVDLGPFSKHSVVVENPSLRTFLVHPVRGG